MIEPIIYEQPLVEHLRICLRLEQLFKQAQYYVTRDADFDSKEALFAMLEIVNIVERPDLRSKLVKALEQQAFQLAKFEQAPDVDNKKLKDFINEVDRLTDYLHAAPGKL